MEVRKMKTIMILDDEQTFHDFCAEMLEDTDYEIINVYGGDEALSMLRERKPDLIIIDDIIIVDVVLNLRKNDTHSLYPKTMPEFKDIPSIITGDFFLQVFKNMKELDPGLEFFDKTFIREKLMEEIHAKIGQTTDRELNAELV